MTCFPQSNFSACQIPDLVQKRKWKRIWSGSIPQSHSNSLDTVVTLESVVFFGGLASSVPAVVHTEAASWAALVQGICMLGCQFLTTCMPPCFPGIRPLEESKSMSVSQKRRHLMVYHRLQQHPSLCCQGLWQWAPPSSHSLGLLGGSVLPLLVTL